MISQNVVNYVQRARAVLAAAVDARSIAEFQEDLDTALANLGAAVEAQRLSGAYRKDLAQTTALKKYLTTSTVQEWHGPGRSTQPGKPS